MTDSNIQIEALKRIRERNVHRKYIEYIRYPRFRNLEDNSKITFDFPITFLVGKNGGGKSSTLQSLYGCPQGYSLGDYWFTTELDPIKELENDRNSFIYAYKANNEIKEVLKQRIQRQGNPDYWETSRPLVKYGMDPEHRNSPLDKKVEYIDFRSELSAFDKYLYFSKFTPGTWYLKKQDFLRAKSKKLKQALDSNTILTYRDHRKNKIKIVLPAEEIEIINKILGKNYSGIEIIEHSWFDSWGSSIRLTNAQLNYSEAFAGSGETAIVMLVHRIYNAEPESLILLDEPETSLHSGAQKRLINYILDVCVNKKHQFIISTHSPFLIENMPDNSIKVFSTIPSGKFIVNNEQNYKEAFFELEINNTEKKQIIVEDSLAMMLVNEVLNKLGESVKSLFEVKFLSGGADAINQRISIFMDISDNTFVLFDGDKKKSDNLINIDEIPPNEQDTYDKVKELIKGQTDCEIKFYPDGGNQNNEEQKLSLAKKYLKYYEDHVFFLPLSIPEDIIWDKDFADRRLKVLYTDKEIDNVIADSNDTKEMIYKLCIEIYNDSKQMNSMYIEFIKNWLLKEDDNFKTISEIINTIK
ncbi:AAA family ATPase [Elizabethkingia sp. HX QKY]|uniref:ATP-dependent nuclease n=1 Tax=Elizabethkingia TaxID=308865 RepID=UPI002A23D0AE|nr:AAA family ATPase [Elizabethkingia sp. HX QKY]MDX8571481.1 AAA family ATPase [Elizabethkingia sp. HX QKY]